MHAPIVFDPHRNAHILLPENTFKDGKHRLLTFLAWLAATQRAWHTPDLAAYRDYLLHDYTGRNGQPLSPASVQAHLATVRGRYRVILRDNTTRDVLYALTRQKPLPVIAKPW